MGDAVDFVGVFVDYRGGSFGVQAEAVFLVLVVC